MEIKQSSSFWAPVRLVNGDGTALTGVAFTAVAAAVQKQASAAVIKPLVSSSWTEINSTLMPGAYDILLSASDTDTVGFLKYYVAAQGGSYMGLLEVEAHSGDDTFSLVQVVSGSVSSSLSQTLTVIGTPVSGTVSADISATLHAVSSFSGAGGPVDLGPVLKVLGHPVKTLAQDIKETARLVKQNAPIK